MILNGSTWHLFGLDLVVDKYLKLQNLYYIKSFLNLDETTVPHIVNFYLQILLSRLGSSF